MFIARKKIRVEYSHQLFTSYTNLCHETIHGHSGIVELFFGCDDLDGDSMVVDFGKISDTIKGKIMEKYDHALFMPSSFPKEYLDILAKYNKRLTIVDRNPTCEMFAKWIYEFVESQLKELNLTNVIVYKVRFHETDSGYAEYSKSDLMSKVL